MEQKLNAIKQIDKGKSVNKIPYTMNWITLVYMYKINATLNGICPIYKIN